MDAETVRIDLADDVDRWEWRCPEGHTQWEPTNRHFWCATCSRQPDPHLDPTFNELVNWRTRETVPRDQIRLVEFDADPLGA